MVSFRTTWTCSSHHLRSYSRRSKPRLGSRRHLRSHRGPSNKKWVNSRFRSSAGPNTHTLTWTSGCFRSGGLSHRAYSRRLRGPSCHRCMCKNSVGNCSSNRFRLPCLRTYRWSLRRRRSGGIPAPRKRSRRARNRARRSKRTAALYGSPSTRNKKKKNRYGGSMDE